MVVGGEPSFGLEIGPELVVPLIPVVVSAGELGRFEDRNAFRNGLSARKSSPIKKDCNNKVNANKHNKNTPSMIPTNPR